MEIFYSTDIDGISCRLNEEESGHCIRVLRHRSGDEIKVMDGRGSLYTCRITDDSPKHTAARIISVTEECNSTPYSLEVAVCPTKNADRYEWFTEKATEIGVSSIVPVIGDHSERKVIKKDRLEKIAVSASKQSLKTIVPQISDTISVKEYIIARHNKFPLNDTTHDNTLKLIACCFEDENHPRTSITDALRKYMTESAQNLTEARQQESAQHGTPQIAVLIGPEGDFSHEEVKLAIESGWVPVHLGSSRLRTETAALTAVEAVYLCNMLFSDNLNLRIYTDLDD